MVDLRVILLGLLLVIQVFYWLMVVVGLIGSVMALFTMSMRLVLYINRRIPASNLLQFGLYLAIGIVFFFVYIKSLSVITAGQSLNPYIFGFTMYCACCLALEDGLKTLRKGKRLMPLVYAALAAVAFIVLGCFWILGPVFPFI